MEEGRLPRVLDRLEAALDRLERARAPSDLAERHERLRAAARDALAGIDRLIEARG